MKLSTDNFKFSPMRIIVLWMFFLAPIVVLGQNNYFCNLFDDAHELISRSDTLVNRLMSGEGVITLMPSTAFKIGEGIVQIDEQIVGLKTKEAMDLISFEKVNGYACLSFLEKDLYVIGKYSFLLEGEFNLSSRGPYSFFIYDKISKDLLWIVLNSPLIPMPSETINSCQILDNIVSVHLLNADLTSNTIYWFNERECLYVSKIIKEGDKYYESIILNPKGRLEKEESISKSILKINNAIDLRKVIPKEKSMLMCKPYGFEYNKFYNKGK